GARWVIDVDGPHEFPELPGLPNKNTLCDDVAFLGRLCADLVGCSRLGVRIEVLDRAMCPRFHVDRVGLRLLCTYLGPGTEYLDASTPTSSDPSAVAPVTALATDQGERIVRFPRGAVVLLKELLQKRQWLGVALGVGGVSVVVIERMGASDIQVRAAALVAMGIAVFGMSAGTLVQRARGKSMPLLRGTAVQFAVSAVALGVGSLAFEGFEIEFTAQLWWSLLWSILVLSLAAILIMLWLLQRQAAVKVSSLFFLTPALSTIEGSILFGERLGALSLVGLAVALVGVALATRVKEPEITQPV
ncbi:MAG: hypothetical protein RL119_177, partial [Actinomycetota bacterium]